MLAQVTDPPIMSNLPLAMQAVFDPDQPTPALEIPDRFVA